MVPEILSSVDASAIKLNDLVQNEVDSGIPLSRIIIGLYSDCTPLLFKLCLNAWAEINLIWVFTFIIWLWCFEGGFSMGGGMAFHVAYRYQREVAGCFALSSFLNHNSVVCKVRITMKVYALIRFIFFV